MLRPVRRLVAGSSRRGREPDDGVATATSAAGPSVVGRPIARANRRWISPQVSAISPDAPGCWAHSLWQMPTVRVSVLPGQPQPRCLHVRDGRATSLAAAV